MWSASMRGRRTKEATEEMKNPVAIPLAFYFAKFNFHRGSL